MVDKLADEALKAQRFAWKRYGEPSSFFTCTNFTKAFCKADKLKVNTFTDWTA